jgi:hypothetical protein
VLLIGAVRAVGDWLPAYSYGLQHGGAGAAIGLGPGELSAALTRILDYTFGRRPDLQFVLPETSLRPGEPAFTEREVIHMADVRALVASVARTHLWLSAAFAVGLAALWLTLRPAPDGAGSPPAALVAKWACGWGSGLAAAAAVAGIADFSWAWDQFHYAFFANDLWQLPPDSLLILLLPPGQFARLVALVVATWLVGLVACAGAASAGLGSRRRHAPGRPKPNR